MSAGQSAERELPIFFFGLLRLAACLPAARLPRSGCQFWRHHLITPSPHHFQINSNNWMAP
jgi:hypothetical protein